MLFAAPALRPAGPDPIRAQYGKNNDLGVKFWSTKDPGQQPFSFNIGLGSVIPAWDEGVMGMKGASPFPASSRGHAHSRVGDNRIVLRAK